MISVIAIAVTLKAIIAARPSSRTVASLTPRALPEKRAPGTLRSKLLSGIFTEAHCYVDFVY